MASSVYDLILGKIEEFAPWLIDDANEGLAGAVGQLQAAMASSVQAAEGHVCRHDADCADNGGCATFSSLIAEVLEVKDTVRHMTRRD